MAEPGNTRIGRGEGICAPCLHSIAPNGACCNIQGEVSERIASQRRSQRSARPLQQRQIRSTPNALALAERTVPRYTSYPTAPHFTAAVGAETYADWLSALPAAATLSLYIHVPYCTELCLYCGCHTKMVRRREPLQAYAERLGRVA